jgi:hypothetical protein
MPADGIGCEEVSEELCDDTKTVGLETVNSLVVVRKTFFKEVGPHAVDLAEALPNHAVKFFICPLLAGALHDHGGEFILEALR